MAWAQLVSTDAPAKCRPKPPLSLSSQASTGDPELPPRVVASWPKTHCFGSPSSEPSARCACPGASRFTPNRPPNSVVFTQIQSTPSCTPLVNGGGPGNPTTQNELRLPWGPSVSATTGIGTGRVADGAPL